jgi:hypothetical protein
MSYFSSLPKYGNELNIDVNQLPESHCLPFRCKPDLSAGFISGGYHLMTNFTH